MPDRIVRLSDHNFRLPDQSRLAEKGFVEAQQAVELLARTLDNQVMVTAAGREVVALIVRYAKTWRLLLQYDQDGLRLSDACLPAKGVFAYEKAVAAIGELKAALMARGEAADLFGQQRGEAFQGILGSIEQAMFGDPLYKSREEVRYHEGGSERWKTAWTGLLVYLAWSRQPASRSRSLK